MSFRSCEFNVRFEKNVGIIFIIVIYCKKKEISEDFDETGNLKVDIEKKLTC